MLCPTLKYMSNSSGITTSTLRLAAILNFVKKKDVLHVLKEDIVVVYRFKSLYVSQILMAIDLLSIKHQTTAI